jgi:hypothetical protein
MLPRLASIALKHPAGFWRYFINLADASDSIVFGEDVSLQLGTFIDWGDEFESFVVVTQQQALVRLRLDSRIN